MPDVIHDPVTDWCACEPEGDDRCDYRLLADAVIASLDVRDGDEAEVALCIEAVERAATALPSVARFEAQGLAQELSNALTGHGPSEVDRDLWAAGEQLTGLIERARDVLEKVARG